MKMSKMYVYFINIYYIYYKNIYNIYRLYIYKTIGAFYCFVFHFWKWCTQQVMMSMMSVVLFTFAVKYIVLNVYITVNTIFIIG